MGSAFKPALRILKATGRQRMRDGWRTQPNAAMLVSPTNSSNAQASLTAATLAEPVVVSAASTGRKVQRVGLARCDLTHAT